MNPQEFREAFDALQKGFTAFKADNDERLRQIEKRGFADPLTEEKVDKIAASVGKMAAKYDDDLKRISALEACLQRPGVDGASNDNANNELKDAAAWLSAAKDRPIDEAEVNLAEIADYSSALLSYLRKGTEFMPEAEKLKLAEFKELSVGSQTEGGYLVNPQISNRIIRTIFETSPIRSVATVESVTSDALEFVVDKDEAAASWAGEKDSRTETDTPDLAMARIPVHEIYAEPHATQKILDDASINIENWLVGKVADKFARAENAAFVTGNGVAKPRGMLDYPAVANASWSWGNVGYLATGAAGGFNATDPGDVLFDVVGALKAGYRTNARWMMNRATVTAIRKFQDGNGNYLWQPGLAAGQPSTLLGYPITEGEDLPDIAANALPLAFGDFAATYTIVDRIGVSVLRDPFTAKPFVKFYTRKRTGGDVVNFESYKVVKIASS